MKRVIKEWRRDRVENDLGSEIMRLEHIIVVLDVQLKDDAETLGASIDKASLHSDLWGLYRKEECTCLA